MRLGALLASLVVNPGRAAETPLRLGIIGLDTSHATTLLRIYNDSHAPDHVPGAKIVAAFKGGSPDVEASRTRIDDFTKTAVEKYGVRIYDEIESLTHEVDAVLLLSVDGRTHLAQFQRALAARKPVFIDKPLGGTLGEAIAILRLTRESEAKVFHASLLRYTTPEWPSAAIAKVGEVRSVFAFGPAEIEPHVPDLFWYGVHTVEALYNIMGRGCERVVRTHTKNTDVVTGIWSDGRVGTMQGNRAGHLGYGVTIVGTKGAVTGGEKRSYQLFAEKVLAFFRTGNAPVALEESVEECAFMEAADESKRRGGAPVTIAEVMQLARAPAAP